MISADYLRAITSLLKRQLLFFVSGRRVLERYAPSLLQKVLRPLPLFLSLLLLELPLENDFIILPLLRVVKFQQIYVSPLLFVSLLLFKRELVLKIDVVQKWVVVSRRLLLLSLDRCARYRVVCRTVMLVEVEDCYILLVLREKVF